MKLKLSPKFFTVLYLIAIPCLFLYIGRYSVRLFARLEDYAKYKFPVAVFLLVGVAISITLFWKSQLFTKRLRRLISFILIAVTVGCFALYYHGKVVDLDADMYVPEAQDLGTYQDQLVSSRFTTGLSIPPGIMVETYHFHPASFKRNFALLISVNRLKDLSDKFSKQPGICIKYL